MWRFRSFIQGLKNLWFYKSVVWYDRWYDHSFMLSIWERKLQSMADNWKDSHYVDSEIDEKEIKQALFLIRILIDDDFDRAEMKEIDEKFGTLEMFGDEMRDDGMRSSQIRRKLETPENEEEIREAFLSALAVGEKRKKDTQDEFFEILKGYERWWD